MVRNSKKKHEITIPDSTDEEENGYLPLKYPAAGKLTQEKLKKFCESVNSEDKKNAGTSKISFFCGECETSIKQNQASILCKGECGKWYHTKCTNLSAKDFEFFSNELKKSRGSQWKCLKCKEMTSATEIMEELTKTVRDLQQSIDFMSNRYEEVKKENSEILRFLKELKKERKEITSENMALKEEIASLKTDVNNLKHLIDDGEQIKLKNNIEIKGISKQMNISDEEITENIFKNIGLEIEKKEIQQIIRSRENSEKTINTLKIIMKNEETKEKILQASRKYYKTKGILTSTEVGLGGKPSIIYINEELTQRNKYLFGKTRELKKFGFKFIWYKNRKIYVRKDETGKPKIIKYEEDIEQLKKTQQ